MGKEWHDKQNDKNLLFKDNIIILFQKRLDCGVQLKDIQVILNKIYKSNFQVQLKPEK